MILVIQRRYGHYQQTIVFAYITPNHRRATVAPTTIGKKNFLVETLLQISHLISVKA